MRVGKWFAGVRAAVLELYDRLLQWLVSRLVGSLFTEAGADYEIGTEPKDDVGCGYCDNGVLPVVNVGTLCDPDQTVGGDHCPICVPDGVDDMIDVPEGTPAEHLVDIHIAEHPRREFDPTIDLIDFRLPPGLARANRYRDRGK